MSVVIPCYNQGRFLSEAVESVFRQEGPTFEVIVVNDGSSDETERVARSFQRLRLINQPNSGLAAARNRGLAASCGRYVVFLDADDRLLPGALATGVAALERNPECAFAYGRFHFISELGELMGTPRRGRVASDHYRLLLEQNIITNPGIVMYRREVFDRVGGFFSSLRRQGSEDYDLYLRITKQFPVFCHHELVLERRRHPASMSRNASSMLQHTLNVHRRQWRFVKGDPRLREAYSKGRQHYRYWYGEPVVTEAYLLLRRGHWQAALGQLWLLARYHRAGLRALVRGLPKSGTVDFFVTPEAVAAPTSSGAVTSSVALTITALDPSHTTVGTGFNVLRGGGNLLRVSCRGASRWTTVIFAGCALETTVHDDRFVTAVVPDGLIASQGTWPVYLLK